jgi:hypothetical protein
VGYLFLAIEKRIDEIPGRGCWVEVVKQTRRLVTGLFRLELDLASPLTPRSAGSERLPRGQQDARLELRPGVWWCAVVGSPEPVYLLVAGTTLRIAPSKAAAYCALGAVDRLNELGLGDAAVALAGGDFDHASVQVIAHRQREAK